MKIHKATKNFEEWLASRVKLVRQDLSHKHQEMATAVFPFLRATFYRWAQVWPEVCPELAAAPKLLAVGDLHVENFGTWRDAEGRLIWGVNDFDEVHAMAYAADLVRLATSAHLAIEGEHLSIRPLTASEAIEEGYRDALNKGGRVFVLGERHRWLRVLALNELRDPVHFWARMESLPKIHFEVPRHARTLLEETLPEKGMPYSLRRRIAGLGSLGHPRIVALAEWRGGFVAREAKALRPSACVWVAGHKTTPEILSPRLLCKAVRVNDPCVHYHKNWIVRRLAPDCSRIELFTLPQKRDEARLLYSMGWETANIHLGDPSAIPLVHKDLARRSGRWLHRAAKDMGAVVVRDWRRWRRG